MTYDQIDEASDLWKQGVSAKRISQVVGCDVDELCHVAQSDRDRFPLRRGRLSQDAVELIREMRDAGMTIRAIADKVGTTTTTVCRRLNETRQDDCGDAPIDRLRGMLDDVGARYSTIGTTLSVKHDGLTWHVRPRSTDGGLHVECISAMEPERALMAMGLPDGTGGAE